MRDGGATARLVFGKVAETVAELAASERSELKAIAERLGAGLDAWVKATEWLAANAKSDLGGVLGAAVPYLHLAITVCGGWQMGRAALAAARKLAVGEGDAGFHAAKIATARFYADQVLPQAAAYAENVQAAGVALAAITDEMF
jgi:acyl-CoA dehydrogenase